MAPPGGNGLKSCGTGPAAQLPCRGLKIGEVGCPTPTSSSLSSNNSVCRPSPDLTEASRYALRSAPASFGLCSPLCIYPPCPCLLTPAPPVTPTTTQPAAPFSRDICRRVAARMRAFPGGRRMPVPCLGTGVPTEQVPEFPRSLARRSYLTGPSRDARRRPRQPPRCGIAVVLATAMWHRGGQAGPGGPVSRTTGTTRPASRALAVEATPRDASSRRIPLNSYHPSRRSRVLQSDGTGRPGRGSPGNCRMPPDLRVDIVANSCSIIGEVGSAPAETRWMSTGRPGLSAAPGSPSPSVPDPRFSGPGSRGCQGSQAQGSREGSQVQGSQGPGFSGPGAFGLGAPSGGAAGAAGVARAAAAGASSRDGGGGGGVRPALPGAGGGRVGGRGLVRDRRAPRGRGAGGAALGLDAGRILLVPDPGPAWPQVTASLLDGCELVLLRPRPQAGSPAGGPGPGQRASRRRCGAGGECCSWPGSGPGHSYRLRVVTQRWTGLGEGHGRLRACCAEVTADGRGEAAMARTRWLWLPGEDGGVALADPRDFPADLPPGVPRTWMGPRPRCKRSAGERTRYPRDQPPRRIMVVSCPELHRPTQGRRLQARTGR